MTREKLPETLRMDYFLVKLPEFSEEDDGLIENSDHDGRVIVEMVGESCNTLKKGDDILISNPPQVIVKFEVNGSDYIVMRERDVIGIW